ncbi:MAG: pseudouridine synthase [Myxococcota bacterium]
MPDEREPSTGSPPPEPTFLARGVDYVIVDKPAGVLVHRTQLAPDRDVMLTRVRDALGIHVFPVHRLDRPTSGCLLFGLSADAVPALQQALHTGTKRYLALVRGRADRYDGAVVSRPLRREGTEQEAVTHLEVLASGPDPRCSVVVARPETGRYHQVRRHLAGLGHPILGDSTHGDTRVNREWRLRGLERLALHCWSLDLPLPDGPVAVVAPLPPDLRAVLAALPFFADLQARLEPST